MFSGNGDRYSFLVVTISCGLDQVEFLGKSHCISEVSSFQAGLP